MYPLLIHHFSNENVSYVQVSLQISKFILNSQSKSQICPVSFIPQVQESTLGTFGSRELKGMPLVLTFLSHPSRCNHYTSSQIYILYDPSLNSVSVLNYLLTSYLKTQQPKITTIHLVHSSVGKQFGLASAGLIYASTVSWQSRFSFICLKIGQLSVGMKE